MLIQINSVNIRYQNQEVVNVQVHFTAHDENREININGYIPLTAEEYAGNESIVTLTEVVRQKAAETLS
ncbi:hypothetical protein [Fervidibacillus albus]|uniref:Uncharacterized protein n=1 Tax=Fervidibacillus albus TaxID=2980026 RepID=A0A9E8RYP1_9BACI|nr:hypothetical protein [Fervidibacillus albus]WAA10847.1 hypothetical protein OE104_05910 [Fervidibacillus albus]